MEHTDNAIKNATTHVLALLLNFCEVRMSFVGFVIYLSSVCPAARLLRVDKTKNNSGIVYVNSPKLGRQVVEWEWEWEFRLTGGGCSVPVVGNLLSLVDINRKPQKGFSVWRGD